MGEYILCLPNHCVLEAGNLVSIFIDQWTKRNFVLGWVLCIVLPVIDLDEDLKYFRVDDIYVRFWI